MTPERTAPPGSDPPATDPLAGVELVVFDKDGTLVDFDAMWVPWVTEIARRLESVTRLPLAGAFYEAVGFDAASGRTIPGGGLSGVPMSDLREQTVDLLRANGLDGRAAETAVASTWYAPDPISSARPLTDLPALFNVLRRRGMRIAVATSDDRAPTKATLDVLGLTELIDGLVCADDAVGVKPAPDIVHWLAAAIGVPPARMAVVGDTPRDLEMGRAAGVRRCIGVLSGVGTQGDLEPLADLVLPSVASLIEYDAADGQ